MAKVGLPKGLKVSEKSGILKLILSDNPEKIMLTLKEPPIICSRQQFQILLHFQK